MKVLHICTYDIGGGAEKFASDFSRHPLMGGCLAVKEKKGQAENVFELPRPLPSQLAGMADKALFKFFKRTAFSDLGVSRELHGTYKALSATKAYREAEILHLHNLHGEYFDLAALPKICKEKKVIWTLHDQWPLTGGEAYVYDSEAYRLGDPITPYHTIYPLRHPIVEYRHTFMEAKKRIYEDCGKNLLFVPISGWMGECLEESYVFGNGLNVKTIPNGIDLQVFKNLYKRYWEKPRLLFLHSGNVYKGGRLLMEIMEKIEGAFELRVLGQKLPEKFEGKYTHIPKTTSPEALNIQYNQADILLFPSECEGFGLVVAEAMAAGMYVIGSDAGGIKEQLQGGTGKLFASGDSAAFLAAISETLQLNLAHIRTLGEKSSEVSCRKYDIQRMYADYERAYERIVSD